MQQDSAGQEWRCLDPEGEACHATLLQLVGVRISSQEALEVAIFRSERHLPKHISHIRGEGHVVGPEVSQDVDELGEKVGSV